jgi:hypothetical protein
VRALHRATGSLPHTSYSNQLASCKNSRHIREDVAVLFCAERAWFLVRLDPECIKQCNLVHEAELSTDVAVARQALPGNDIRTEKIAGLQQSINAGIYHVSSSDIAGKLIDALVTVIPKGTDTPAQLDVP